MTLRLTISSSVSWKGNFQDGQKMKLEKAIRVVYGRFFYRFPNGESAADVYDRITGTYLSSVSVASFARTWFCKV